MAHVTSDEGQQASATTAGSAPIRDAAQEKATTAIKAITAK